jgi:hypothetical protein
MFMSSASELLPLTDSEPEWMWGSRGYGEVLVLALRIVRLRPWIAFGLNEEAEGGLSAGLMRPVEGRV